MADLTGENVAQVLLGDFTPFQQRGVPEPNYVDSGTGLRGVDGATAFPAGIALAASFDEDLAAEYGAAVGREARRAGFNVVLGPTVDLARDPLGGRIAEAFGEDPVLAGRMGAAHLSAMQAQHVVAQVKHYVAYTTETRRTGHGLAVRGDALDVRASDALLHDLYLRPFESVVRAGAWSLMGSYNRLNGRYVCQSATVLDIPRRLWGWRGFYCPDFLFAVRDPQLALQAGLDLPALGGDGGRTRAMVDEAEPGGARESVARVARALIASGVVDDAPAVRPEVSTAEHQAVAHRAAVGGTVALRNTGLLPLSSDVGRVAVIGPAGADAFHVGGGAASVSLTPERITTPLDAIRSRAGTRTSVVHAQGSWGDVPLPAVPAGVLSVPGLDAEGVAVQFFDAESTRTQVLPQVAHNSDVAVPERDWPAQWRTRLTPRESGPHRFSLTLGGLARMRIDGRQVLAGSREAHQFISGPQYPLQAVAELRAGQPVDIEIDYEPGPAIVIGQMGLGPSLHLGWQEPDSLIDDAVAAAADAEVAVVFANMASGEGMDRTSMTLPGDQDELIRRVAGANRNTVVVLNTPGAVEMPWLEQVAAVLQVWYPGECFGAAVAAILFGDEEPGGRLPLTFPRKRDHLPATASGALVPMEVDYDADGGIGYRSPAVLDQGALFPFGFGLGYSPTEADSSIDQVDDDEQQLTVRVRNLGVRDTVHVAQIYAAVDGVEPWELLSWIRIPVESGATAQSQVSLTPDLLRRWDGTAQARLPRPGTHRLKVCAHAEDPGQQFDWVIAGAAAP
nr:glycoside hydrolase family 3 C-terminal domain-containing protein [Tessaracoccus sp. OS52]